MNTREIRRRCRKIVSALDIPSPFDVRQFCAGLATSRGRRIELCPMAMPPDSPCGVWVSTADGDYIFYEQDTTWIHQEHIIMHEVGHIVTGHDCGAALSTAVSQLLVPHLDPALISRVLHRTEYSDTDERAAEMVASMILERASRFKPASEWEASADGADVRRRLNETFEPATERRPS